MAQVIKNRWLKIILRTLSSFLIIIALAFVALQIPYVQTRLIQKIAGYLTEKTGYPTSINGLSIQWFDRLKANEVTILDPDSLPMIHAREIFIDFELSALWQAGEKFIDYAEVDSAKVYARIIQFNDTLTNLNLTEYFNRIRNLNQSEGSTRASILFDEVVLKNSFFAYQDTRKDSIIPGFNYYNFNIADINAHLNDFNIRSDTIQMNINTLTAHVPENKLPIHSITGQFRYSRKALEFNGIEVRLGKSVIRDTVIMAYETPEDLQDFNNKVEMVGKLKNSKIHTSDLGLFVPSLKKVNDLYKLSGTFDGRVNNFHLSDALLEFGKNTKLHGEIRMEGLPYVDETFMNYNLENSYVHIEDLRPYIKGTTIDRIQHLDYFHLNGRLIGFVNDFVAHGEFDTKMGKIVSDINLKLSPEINNSEYSGELTLIKFDLGTYSEKSYVGEVSLNGKIKGKGLSVEKADFNLEGQISSIEFNRYTYQNIKTKGRFKNKFFEGSLSINDPNASMSFSGSVDLKSNEEKFFINSSINKLNLKPLNFSSRDIVLHGKTMVNASGLHMDSIQGEAIISDALIKVDKKKLAIDTMTVYARRDGEKRNINLQSDLLDIAVAGNFSPSRDSKSIKSLFDEYILAIKNNSSAIDDHYKSKSYDPESTFAIDFDVQVNNFNPFLNLFRDSLFVEDNTHLKGNLSVGYSSTLNLKMNSDSLRFRHNAFKDVSAEITTTKISDSTTISANIDIQSGKQQFGKALHTENLNFQTDWMHDHIDFTFVINQQGSSNNALIKGELNFLKDNVELSFHNSAIQIFEKNWIMPEDNLISIREGEVAFDGFALQHESQKIRVNGKLNRSEDESLEIMVDSVNLNILNPALLEPIDGIMHGRISFMDVYNDFKVNIIASVKDFHVDNFKVGDVTTTTFYNDLNKKSDITFVVKRSKALIGVVKGTYEHKKQNNQLDLDAQIKNAPLNILEPFFDSYFTSVQGNVTANVNISGTPLQPRLNGKGIINDGGLFVSYLKTFYDFNGEFSVEPNSFNFHDLKLTDEENNNGTLGGTILHEAYRNWTLDLTGQVNNFLVLNTTSADNELFYGTGYGTGTISFKGGVNNLNIAAQATTEPGTRIFIPIGETGEVQQQEFINFMSFNDSTLNSTTAISNKVDLTGISLDLALDVTPDAYCEIIFDIKSGDIIRGRGEGDLRMVMDAAGEFSMFGDFYIKEGGYNFTLYNIVNKEFQILPNSRISWYGDPYEGQLDIQASYEQFASLKPVIPEVATLPTEDVPVEIRRQYPSKVLMDLNGPLLSPHIDFNIVVENLPNYQVTLKDGTPIEMNFLFGRFKDSWDEQELNRQVFSLIVLRKFSPLQSFSTGGSIASSVSELLSNQLSYWITQVNENLEIDVNLGSLNDEAFNTFQLRLAYTMFDGRLRIVRDGGFTNPYETTDSKVPGIIGDWTVEYLLTSDGKLRVKMYNRTNYNTLDVNQNQSSVITTGFSIQHTQSFDEIKDLFKKTRDNSQNNNPEDKALHDAVKNDEDEIL